MIRRAVVLLSAIACAGAAYLAGQQARTHAFEQRLLTLEVENRERLADVLLLAGESAPAPDLPGDGGARLELRARWWMAWAERSERIGTRTDLMRRARDELRALRDEEVLTGRGVPDVLANLGEQLPGQVGVHAPDHHRGDDRPLLQLVGRDRAHPARRARSTRRRCRGGRATRPAVRSARSPWCRCGARATTRRSRAAVSSPAQRRAQAAGRARLRRARWPASRPL